MVKGFLSWHQRFCFAPEKREIKQHGPKISPAERNLKRLFVRASVKKLTD